MFDDATVVDLWGQSAWLSKWWKNLKWSQDQFPKTKSTFLMEYI